ncbi:MAG: ferritin-like domain-containing protein [Tepidisphaeraceae bacterium]
MKSPNSTPSKSIARRGFLCGVGAATAAGFGLLRPAPASAATYTLTLGDIPGTGDVQVLNYALALEALETDLYIQSYMRLTYGGTNGVGVDIPGLGFAQDEPDVIYVKEFANVEKQHRDFIDDGLGDASILRSRRFQGVGFDFGIETLSRQEVLALLYTAESAGVAAYLGAIPFLSTKTYLQTAAAIQGTEARHTATIALLQNMLFGTSIPVAPLATTNNGIDASATPNATLAAVSPFFVFPS